MSTPVQAHCVSTDSEEPPPDALTSPSWQSVRIRMTRVLCGLPGVPGHVTKSVTVLSSVPGNHIGPE
ncbi:hypothetical protein M2280_001704 [Prescottella agglutinans]|uniref:Uncharacterized protein n=1 Tax=Prescottella agglutinans TaxID=1644129 RepID=A0ABT6M874_9NOCA|nr:hypothetical protein [Prescottella agglutinans]